MKDNPINKIGRYFKAIILLTALSILAGCGGKSTDSGGDDPSANNPPEILSITAEPPTVGVGGSTSIVVEVTDPEGDFLYYGWSASGGSILGDGPSAAWNAPENQGNYIISVYIEDDRLGRVNGTVEVQVVDSGSDNRPPVIRYINSNPDILPTRGRTELTVGAYDPDGDDNELVYRWGGPGGAFEGQGSSVTWTAPSPGCCPTALSIWVVISDAEGATSTRSTEIVVIP
jgi:hypothetical protein